MREEMPVILISVPVPIKPPLNKIQECTHKHMQKSKIGEIVFKFKDKNIYNRIL